MFGMPDVIAIIIVVLGLGIAWSVGLIIVPFYRAFNRGEIPSAISLFFFAVTLSIATYTAISAANGGYPTQRYSVPSPY